MSHDKLLEALTRDKSHIKALADKSTISRVVERIPTGILTLDMIMGGGVPVGRFIEIYGDSSTAKSLLANHIIAEAQELGGVGVLFDSETASDEGFMEMVGVNPEAVLYSTPSTIEELYDEYEKIMRAKRKYDPNGLMVIVWDSVAATSTKGELDAVRKKGMGAATMGIHARLISQLCRIVNTDVSSQRLAFVFINQTRTNIGVMFGPSKSTFGGRAIAYYSSVRLEMKHIRKLVHKSSDQVYGIDVRVGVAKNKVGRPFGMCEIPVLFDIGMDEPGAILWWLKNKSLITGAAWKTIELDGVDHKFRHREWEQFYYQHEQAVRNAVIASKDLGWAHVDEDEDD